MIKTLIVDDEPLALDIMASLLSAHDDVEIIGSCRSGAKALEAIQALAPDLVFLDIQMPGMSGFELISKIQPERLPAVVFATAYDSFAVDAFRVHALDYLLKPIDPKRLAESLEHIRGQLALAPTETSSAQSENKGKYLDVLSHMQGSMAMHAGDLASNDPLASDERLAIRDGAEVKLIPHEDIDWVDAAGDYMCVHASGDTHIMRCTMKELQERLAPGPFARIHRSTVVNLRKVLAVTALSKGESELTLAGSVRLKVSRNYKAEVAQLKRS
jgi:two-component system LytT family response regulator